MSGRIVILLSQFRGSVTQRYALPRTVLSTVPVATAFETVRVIRGQMRSAPRERRAAPTLARVRALRPEPLLQFQVDCLHGGRTAGLSSSPVLKHSPSMP